MNVSRLGYHSLRPMTLALIVVLLVTALATTVGCGSIANVFSRGSNPQDSTGSSASVSSSPETAVDLPTFTPSTAATAQPTAAPALETAVTQEQAEATVRAWFKALEAEDYQRAENLTTGEARRETQQLVETIQREASQRGVTEDIAVQRLELSPSQALADTERAVKADFEIVVNAVAGPFSVQGQQFEGESTFIVKQVDGEAKITDIQDITGLPSL